MAVRCSKGSAPHCCCSRNSNALFHWRGLALLSETISEQEQAVLLGGSGCLAITFSILRATIRKLSRGVFSRETWHLLVSSWACVSSRILKKWSPQLQPSISNCKGKLLLCGLLQAIAKFLCRKPRITTRKSACALSLNVGSELVLDPSLNGAGCLGWEAPS